MILAPERRPTVVRIAALLAVGVAIVLLVASQSRHPYQVVDGFPIGGSPACGTCADEIAQATRVFDARDPGHATIQSATAYGDVDPCRNGLSKERCRRDSHVVVVVFQLSDRSTHATGVACIGVSPCAGTATYPFSLP